MQTCPDCGCRVYNLGCVNCNEIAYIEEQEMFDAIREAENPYEPLPDPPSSETAP